MNITHYSRATGFTLVEMLVVIAVISIVATASINAVKGGQRQARAVKCQANLHALHTAVMAYYADSGYYPFAGAYETLVSYTDSNGSPRERYDEKRGWVNWVLKDSARSRRKSSSNKYPGGVSYDKSQAGSYIYVGTGVNDGDVKGATDDVLNRVMRSIDEGSIFSYTDKNASIYRCEAAAEYCSKELNAKNKCMRSYVMNQSFGCAKTKWYNLSDEANLSRTAMLVEMNKGCLSPGSGSCTEKAGKNAKNGNDVSYLDDSVWNWDVKDEQIPGGWHRKAGKDYTHVLFADGHIESIAIKDFDSAGKFSKELGRGYSE